MIQEYMYYNRFYDTKIHFDIFYDTNNKFNIDFMIHFMIQVIHL